MLYEYPSNTDARLQQAFQNPLSAKRLIVMVYIVP